MAKVSQSPDFLVIGGMKCATTTLHQDLSQHPMIECGKKELNALTQSKCLDSIRSIYAENFHGAPADAILGDVSTTYSMLPDHQGIPEKARSISGPNLKIVYVVRDPIKRTLSHHQHMMNQANNKLNPDINVAIRKSSELIEYSQYDRQVEPWVEQFGIGNIIIVKFENYVSDRMGTLAELFRFLNVANHALVIDAQGANRTGQARVAGPWMSRIYRTTWFQKVAKPLSPSFLRHAMRALLLRKTTHSTIAPTTETIDLIVEQLREDQDRFTNRFGWSHPLWDLDSLRENYVGKDGVK